MNDRQLRFLPEDVCPALRTKTLHLNQAYRTTAFEERAASNVAVFRCLVTMLEWGPDEEEVRGDLCRPGRSCYCGEAGSA